MLYPIKLAKLLLSLWKAHKIFMSAHWTEKHPGFTAREAGNPKMCSASFLVIFFNANHNSGQKDLNSLFYMIVFGKYRMFPLRKCFIQQDHIFACWKATILQIYIVSIVYLTLSIQPGQLFCSTKMLFITHILHSAVLEGVYLFENFHFKTGHTQ